jgi:hypothetical protein
VPRPLVLSDRTFGLLWASEAVATVGSGLRSVALPWLVLSVTGRPLGLGLAFALRSAPDVVVAPAVGRLLDTRYRKAALVAATAVGGLVVAGLGALAATGRATPAHVYAAALALSVTGNVAHNARRAALPTVVGDDALDAANAWLSGTRSALSLSFLLVGGAATALAGAGVVLLAAGAAGLLAAAVAALLRGSLRSPCDETSADGESQGGRFAGLRAVVRTPQVRLLVAAGVGINLFVAPLPSVVLPTLGEDGFRSVAAFTALLAAYRGGDAAGNAVVDRSPFGRWATLVAGVVGTGAALAAAGLAGTALPPAAGARPALAVLCGLLALAGLAQPLYDVSSSSLLQSVAPDAERGRVVTATNSLLQASFPVPLLAAGWLLGRTDAVVVLGGAGLGLLALAGVLAAVTPAGR